VATDEPLMDRFQQGDDNAFEQIVRRWEGRMLNFFYRGVGDVDTAKDLRQELFLRLYVHGKSYRGEGSFVAWLYSVAANLLRSRLAKARRQAPALDPDPDEPSEPVEAVDGGPMPDTIAQHHERARLVREMLADLATRDREVLVLRFFGNLRFEEISKVLGIGESAAKLRAIRALERLRRMIAERGFTTGDLL